MADERVMTNVADPIGKGEDPLYYYTLVYLSFLQGLFRTFPTGAWKYSEDDEITEIIIADQASKTREEIPRIITMRGPAQFYPLSFYNILDRDTKTEQKHTSFLICSSMAINCIAKNGIEAQKLALTVANGIVVFKHLLQTKGFHKIDHALIIGPETVAQAIFSPEVIPEGVMVTVQSPFYIRYTIRATPTDNPLLKGINTYMTSMLSPADDTHAKEQFEKMKRQSRNHLIPIGPVSPIDSYSALDESKFLKQEVKDSINI